MYLKKLELHGFKSFASATALEFPRGISAVVGPNGSGKSNIADALRFVLGEQSMKSIRSKKGEDLIFSGSPSKQRLSMASVALHFDNEDRTFPVEFGTVVFKRKIFRDGENQYFLNDAQVRLKDLVELIAKAKLGLKGYTVINQGMGDAILDASPTERKEIIFEALGLKEFQLKKAEALLKLSHTQINLEKAEGIVKEIEPHLKFLRRQAEKLEERQEVEEKLKKLETTYVVKRLRDLEEKQSQLKKSAAESDARIAGLKNAIDATAREMEAKDSEVARSFEGTAHLEGALVKEETRRNAVEREIGKIEGMLALVGREGQSRAAVDISYVRSALEGLHRRLEDIMGERTYESVREKLAHFAREFSDLLEGVKSGNVVGQRGDADNSPNLENEQKRLADLLEKSDARLKEIKDEIKRIHGEYGAKREHIFELKNVKREKELELAHAEEGTRALKENIARMNAELELLSAEKSQLESAGHSFLIDGDEPPLSASEEELRRNIERIKIRLENIDLIDDNIGKEYEETKKRYEFLTRESEDLRQAIASLHKVIAELDDVIGKRFEEAFRKISENFNVYFKLLFEGGSARLEAVDEREEEEESGEGSRADSGVDIHVSLPRKKTAGLSVLSGGERALTSLALLFALVSTSPPPFLVLDEVDAPLDEANSFRFGKILAELKSRTQFVVITHNRETMRQSDILYGVTMQEDGISKLFSLKFEAAKEMAR